MPFLFGEFNGCSFCIDCLDGYNWIAGSHEKNLDYFTKSVNADFIFKRNYTLRLQELKPASKILTYGFNYPVGHHTPIGARFVKDFFRSPYWSMRYRRLLNGYFDYRSFEYDPNFFRKKNILYQVRLWDPASSKDNVNRDQRIQMNEFRIACVRVLRNGFPEHSITGVEDSPISRQLCPDLIIPSQSTSRSNYFELLRKSAIGVTSNGLHQSIGWKMGEYIAASRAIVCERPYFLFPPHFLEGQNYLPFSTPEELLSHVDLLLSQPQYVDTMMAENRKYYLEYQRPDRLVWHMLKQML